jgi:hypothetical protein
MEETQPLSSGSFQAEESPLPDILSDQEDIIGGEPEEERGGETPEDDIDIELTLDQPDLDELGNDDMPLDSQDFDRELTSSSPDETAEENLNEESFNEESLNIIPDEITSDELNDSEELRQLREEGALPMTPAPEDTSYLDEEALKEDLEETGGEFLEEPVLEEPILEEISFETDSLDEAAIDLSTAVIDEPDLSGEITENPLQEPALNDLSMEDISDDISIDLDMEDEVPSPDELGTVEDLTLPEEELELSIAEEPATEAATLVEEAAAPEEESFAQVIPEGFVVEADDSQVPFEDDPEEQEALSEGDIDTLEKNQEIEEETDEAAGEEGEETEFISEDEGLDIPSNIKQELRTVLSYMDQLLESLPEDKIEEFAKSEYFDTYKKLFKELGLV